jgi:hypothetical protein
MHRTQMGSAFESWMTDGREHALIKAEETM